MPDTWQDLNQVIRDASEELCLQLLEEEKQGRKRERFLLRIHSRLNKLRGRREREELKQL